MYENDLKLLIGEKKDKYEVKHGVIAEREKMFHTKISYSDAETDVNKRVKCRKI